MNITIKIDAPELVGAIENLAAALGGNRFQSPPLAVADTAAEKEEVSADTSVAEKEAAALEAKATKLAAEAKKAVAAENAAKAKKAADLAAIKKADAALAIDVAPEDDAETNQAESTITLEVVRGKLAAHAAQGKEQQIEVRDALSRFGVKKLTDVETSDYAELLELVGVAL